MAEDPLLKGLIQLKMGKFSVWWGLRVIQNPEIFEKFSPPPWGFNIPKFVGGWFKASFRIQLWSS